MKNTDIIQQFIDDQCNDEIIIGGVGQNSLDIRYQLDRLGKKIFCHVAFDSNIHAELFEVPVYSIFDLLMLDLTGKCFVMPVCDIDYVAEILHILCKVGFSPRKIYPKENFFRLSPHASLRVVTSTINLTCDVNTEITRADHLHEKPGFKIYGQPRTPKTKVFVALGGSTTDATQLDRGKSWPEHLFEHLQSVYGDVMLLNGGVSGFSTNEELVKLLRDVIPIRPNVVISYSGFNDSNNKGSSISSINENLPLPYYNPRHGRPYMLLELFIKRRIETMSQAKEGAFVNYGLKSKHSWFDRWLANMRIMHILAKEYSFDFLGIFQPSMCFSRVLSVSCDNKLLSDQCLSYGQMSITPLKYNTDIDEAKKRIAKYDYLRDYTDIFDKERDIYYDCVHVTPKGNRIIAERVCEDLVAMRVLQ